MKKLLFAVILVSALAACDNNTKDYDPAPSSPGIFKSEKVNGRMTTDFATAQELKGMRISIENFTLLNKKKFENLKAYQQFGDILQNHLDRTTASCGLDDAAKTTLCSKLDKMKPEINTLHGDDMIKSKEAVKNVNRWMAEIDSSFSYMN